MFPSARMARRPLNAVALCVIIILCILLIYASNRISLSSFSSAPPVEFMRNIKVHNPHRQYLNQNYENHNYNGIDSANRRNAKYNHIMHPHNTEQRAHHKFVGGAQTSESATAATTNFINMTVIIEDIIDAQRQRIATKMKDFEYTEQMIGLSALTPETNGQPLQSGRLRMSCTFLIIDCLRVHIL